MCRGLTENGLVPICNNLKRLVSFMLFTKLPNGVTDTILVAKRMDNRKEVPLYLRNATYVLVMACALPSWFTKTNDVGKWFSTSSFQAGVA